MRGLVEQSGAFDRVVKLEYLLDCLHKSRRLDLLGAIGSFREERDPAVFRAGHGDGAMGTRPWGT